MFKRDFLIRQLSEMIKFLIGLLLGSNDLIVRKINMLDQAADLTGLKESELTSLSSNEIIARFERENLGLEKIELIALVLLHNFESGSKSIHQLKTSGELLQYIDQNSNCFSFERKDLLKKVVQLESEEKQY